MILSRINQVFSKTVSKPRYLIAGVALASLLFVPSFTDAHAATIPFTFIQDAMTKPVEATKSRETKPHHLKTTAKSHPVKTNPKSAQTNLKSHPVKADPKPVQTDPKSHPAQTEPKSVQIDPKPTQTHPKSQPVQKISK